MIPLSQVRTALESLGLVPGLPLAEIRERLATGVHLEETGQRLLAFYLVEMEEARHHMDAGNSSTWHFAEQKLQIDRRRTAELIAVGRKLLTLPAIDLAFCTKEIGWSKVKLLCTVASPEHEAAWLERAKELSCRALAELVKRSEPGGPPRAFGDRRGIHECRYRFGAEVAVGTHQKLQLAQKKLCDENGRLLKTSECLDMMAELVLNLDEDGTVPGKVRVDSSLYRIVLHSKEDDEDGALFLDTDEGRVPVEDPGCLICDAETVRGDDGVEEHAPPTPPALRRRVLTRDGNRCRCCGSRFRLMAHHIRFRSHGGPTSASNLIGLCQMCHSMVHAGLLVLEGETEDRVRFLDRTGRPVNGARDVANLPSLSPPPSRPAPQPEPAREPVPFEKAFGQVVGQDALLECLETTGKASAARGKPFPHTLLTGPSGTGKTTIAQGLAGWLGKSFLKMTGPTLQSMAVLVDALLKLKAGAVLFLEEVHAAAVPVLEALYEAISEQAITLPPEAGGHRVELPAFTLVVATSEEGDLPGAFVGRFGLRESLGHYEPDVLGKLVVQKALADGFQVEEQAAARLAEASRGTPREALRLLDRTLDEATTAGSRTVGVSAVETTLRRMRYVDGLTPLEQRYLAVLRSSPGPVSLARIAFLLGENVRTVRGAETELFRRGLVRTTPRGRVAVSRAA